MSDGTYRRVTEAALVVHQRRDDGNCLCGRLTLGESWAAHVAGVLDDVGALRDHPPADPRRPQRCTCGHTALEHEPEPPHACAVGPDCTRWRPGGPPS